MGTTLDTFIKQFSFLVGKLKASLERVSYFVSTIKVSSGSFICCEVIGHDSTQCQFQDYCW